MSDLPTSQDNLPESAATIEPPTTPAAATTAIEPAVTSPAPSLHASSAPEMEAVLEIIRRGLAPDADAAARANALEVCGRIVQAFGPPVAAPPVAVTPVPSIASIPATSPPFTMPQGFAPAAPASPLAAAVGMLRNLPPEQLFDLAIQRLRAALPQGATIAEPKGIQFQLVPGGPSGGKP
jgi:hypothetical protein